METIRALSVEIGPRGACSNAELRAAEWCAAQLSAAGYEATTETFPSRPSYHRWFASYFLVSAVGALFVVPLPLVAVVLGLAGFLLYARDSDGRPLISPATGESRNVVAHPRSASPPDVIVMAHMDSAHSSPSFNPKVVGNFHASVVALNVALLAVPALAAGAWIAEASRELPAGLWIPAGIVAGYLAFAAGLLLYGEMRMGVVPGANDNASGVAVLMRLARMDWGGRAWFVVTGSEEVGMLGARAFQQAHTADVGGARLLNIDNVGNGRLLALSGEGVLRERRPDPYMLDVAVEAGAAEAPFKGLPTDATVMLAHRVRALTLLTVGDDDVPVNWHWPTDTIDAIDPAALDRATEVAATTLRSLLEESVSR